MWPNIFLVKKKFKSFFCYKRIYEPKDFIIPITCLMVYPLLTYPLLKNFLYGKITLQPLSQLRNKTFSPCFQETVNSYNLEAVNHIAHRDHVNSVLHSAMKTHLLTNQNERTIQIIL